MRKSIARILIAIAVLIAVVILVPVVVYVTVPKDRVRQMVVTRLEAKLQRPVQIRKADYSVFPGVKLRLEGVDLGGRAEPGKPWIAASRVSLGMRLLPLLRKQVVITGIEIERPMVTMILQSPAATPPPPARPPAPPSQAVNLQVQSFKIRNGSVDIRTADNGPLLRIAGLSEDLTARLGRGVAELQGTTGVDTLRFHMPAGDFGQGLRLKLQKKLRYDLAGGRLDIDQAALDFAGVPIAVKGNVTGLSTQEPVLDLALQGGPGNISDIIGLVPAQLFPQKQGLKSSGTLALNGTIRGPAKNAGFNILLALDNGRIEDPKLPQPIEGIRLRVQADPESVVVQDFAARTGNSSLRAKATLTSYKTAPRFLAAIDGDVDLGAVSGYYASPDSMQMSGRAVARVIAEGEANNPNAVQFNGTARLSNVNYRNAQMKVPVTGLNGDLLFTQQTLTMQGLSGNMGRSDFNASGTLKNFQALQPKPRVPGRAVVNLRVRSRQIVADDWMMPPGGAGGAGGKAPRGAPMQPLPPLDGTIGLTADKFLMRGIEGANVAGTVILDNGVIRFQNLGMNAFGGQIGLGGDLDLRNVKEPRFALTTDARGVSVQSLFAQARNLDKFARIGPYLSGRMQAHAAMSGTLTDSMMVNPATLTSTGNLEIAQAQLSGYPVQSAIASFLNSPQLDKLGISDWKQAFHIEQGRLNVEGLTLKAGPIEVLANGWQALDGSMKLSADVLLPPELSQGVRSKLPAEAAAILFAGNPNQIFVPMLLDGTVTGPKVGLDTGRLTAAARQQAQAQLAQQRAKLEQEARQQAGKILQGVIPGTADTTKAGTKQQIENEIKNRLGRLFGK